MGLWYRTAKNVIPLINIKNGTIKAIMNDDSVEIIKPIKQNDIFNDIYTLGKTVASFEVDIEPLNIINWHNTRTIRYLNKREKNIKKNKEWIELILEDCGEKGTSLSYFLSKYLEILFDSGDFDLQPIDDLLQKLIDKHGLILEQSLLSYKGKYLYHLEQVVVFSFLFYELVELLNGIKEDKNISGFHKIFYIENITSNQRAFMYIKDIIKRYFSMVVSLVINDDEMQYRFLCYTDIALLKLYALVKELDYTNIDDPKVVVCEQCGFLFVREKGKRKKCSDECYRIDDMLRQRKKRAKGKELLWK